MDMSKAFDTLHHSLTLAKIKAYGFSDGSLDLTLEKSKSTERTLRIVYNTQSVT